MAVPSTVCYSHTTMRSSYTKEVTKAELEALEGKCTGCRDEGELITLKVVPLDTLWQEAPDGKTLAAVLLYEKLTAAGKL